METRKKNRLCSWDYSQNGGYFITICTHHRQQTLGVIAGGTDCPCMTLSPWGKLVEQGILQIPLHYPHVEVNQFAIMPNHVHLLLLVQAPTHGRMVSSPTISTVVG